MHACRQGADAIFDRREGVSAYAIRVGADGMDVMRGDLVVGMRVEGSGGGEGGEREMVHV